MRPGVVHRRTRHSRDIRHRTGRLTRDARNRRRPHHASHQRRLHPGQPVHMDPGPPLPIRLLRLLALPRATGAVRRVLVDHRLRPHTGRQGDVHRRRPPHDRRADRRLGVLHHRAATPRRPPLPRREGPARTGIARTLAEEARLEHRSYAARRPRSSSGSAAAPVSRSRRSARPRNSRWSDTHHKHNFAERQHPG